MIIQDINIPAIRLMLKELPKEKKYNTNPIAIARGLYKYNNSIYKRIKRLING